MASRYPKNTGANDNDPSSNPQRAVEVEEKSYCRACNLTFISWDALHQHKSRHPRHRKTYCSKCGKGFATEDAANTHHLQFHSAEQDLPCPHCGKQFTRLGGLVHHIESKQCPAAKGFNFKERVAEKKIYYDDHDNVITRAEYGNTAGDFHLPPLDFSSSEQSTPQLQPTRPPQSPISTYSTHGTSDTDLQSNYLATESALDDTQSDVESRPGGFFGNEDLMSFNEPVEDLTKKAKAPISQRNTSSAQPAQDDVNFPSLRSLSLNTNAPTNNKWVNNARVKLNLKPATPPVQNAWTNKAAPLSSAANVNNTKPVTPAALNPWGTKPPANPKSSAEWVSLPLANMNASAQASTKEKTEWHPLDPKNPRFDVSIFYCSYLDKYRCPRPLCSKSVNTPGAFIQHLQSSAHQKNYQCKRCLNHFATIAALTQHSESQSTRCIVRKSDFYGGVVDEITAGIAAPVGLHADKSTRYIVNDPETFIENMQKEKKESWDQA